MGVELCESEAAKAYNRTPNKNKGKKTEICKETSLESNE